MLKNSGVVLMLMVAMGGSVAIAQSTFPGFTSGNLVVSRTVYTGDANSVTVGQSLPPVCPATAEAAKKGACAIKAVANGAYPGVFANNGADGSFGITSPIFLDQLNPTTGVLINTLPIPPNMVTTSFSSKSELAVNRSTDGTALTFMGYVAPPNTLDVSNANTPGVYDPTNPAGGSYYRAVVQVNANGTIQVTPTNAYSGNNGRAAILANGVYYMAGNNNNGAGAVPAFLISSTGVEIATPGQALSTVPTEVGTFSISQLTDPTTGKPYAPDKAGKDTNFRGLTVFNNTLYVTKGSGGNGVNTVYQVGAAGTLPTLANATSATINVLPGFPQALATNSDKTFQFPFGIWFANATTLYVADEGDGAAADAASSTMAGIQKWSLVGGTWKMLYVLQNGLNLGLAYSIPNYPASLNPATAGLRNLTGNVNSDGTVTLWAVTSTVSSNGDQGADPNKLVMIVDTLANTDPVAAAKAQFTTLKTANAGEVLRGVSLAPAAGTTPATGAPEILSAATPSITSLAPGSLGFALGQGFATGIPDEILGPLPTAWEGTSVSIVDSKGTASPAPLVFVSQDQVTFQVPSTVATGNAQVKITGGGSTQTASNVVIAAAAPALFTINGSSLAAAYAVRVSGGNQIVEPAYTINSSGGFTATPISLGASSDQTFLSLFGTGLQTAGIAGTAVTLNGVSATVVYVGPQGSVPGLDQVNVQIPASLAGKGTADIQLTSGGVLANQVAVTIQ